ncbi:hypothetical protein MAR_010986 [Mya arenaria]|uniref:Endonuclease/exonuclease/phosphatase domain-containing protein n=1 Tax=Mya arenaria TaxID=6604 RepID=A0ABY7FSZ4_MYAAR|nr:hypothetical protein MAR_010986 [Mya arenaria]
MKKSKNRCIIRLNLQADQYANLVLEEGFWPPFVMCKPCLSRFEIQQRQPPRFNECVATQMLVGRIGSRPDRTMCSSVRSATTAAAQISASGYQFNVLTWNVTGIFSSSSYLSDVLIEKNVHICGLSEHWLYPHNLHALNLCVTSAKGAKGGVALLWHRQLDHLVSPLPIDDDRLIGCICLVRSLIFRDYIDKLYDLWCSYSQWGTVVFLCDFNAKYTADSHVTRDRLLYSLLCDTNMVALNTFPLCTGASHSYVSYDDSCQTLIDFICIPAEIVYTCTHCEMIDDNCLNTIRHRPILCTLKLGDTISESNYTNADVNLQINWNKTRQKHICEYNALLQDDTELNNIIHSELGVDSIDNPKI